jgi:hypothetical protein
MKFKQWFERQVQPGLMKGVPRQYRHILQHKPEPDEPRGGPLGQYAFRAQDPKSSAVLRQAKNKGFLRPEEDTLLEEKILYHLNVWISRRDPIPCDILKAMVDMGNQGLYRKYFAKPKQPVYRGTSYSREEVTQWLGGNLRDGKHKVNAIMKPQSDVKTYAGESMATRCFLSFSKKKGIALNFADESRIDKDKVAIIVTAYPNENNFVDIEPFLHLMAKSDAIKIAPSEAEVLSYGDIRIRQVFVASSYEAQHRLSNVDAAAAILQDL